jgi:hypothetical protein
MRSAALRLWTQFMHSYYNRMVPRIICVVSAAAERERRFVPIATAAEAAGHTPEQEPRQDKHVRTRESLV